MTTRRYESILVSAAAPLATLGIALSLASLSTSARADVTVQQQTSLDAAGLRIDTTTVERTATDKRRSDSDTHCRGFLALFCRNVKSGEIVRLDRQLEWRLEPKTKTYLETVFPTPEQRAQAQQRMREMMDKMKQCAQQPQTKASASAPDTSRCELSPPTVSVAETNEHAIIAGHDTRKSSVILAQSCTDKENGDVCEFHYGFDMWLTADEIPGAAERTTFERRYRAAQGLDPNDPEVRGAMQQFMAQYMDVFKQVKEHASSLKGYPLRTTFSVSFGGPHCGKAHGAAQQQAGSAGGQVGFGSIASSAIRGGLGGLFRRGASAIHTDSAAGAAAAGAANEAADPAAAAAANAAARSQASGGGAAASTPASPFAQVMSFTVETKSIDTSPIAADQFEIPTGWKLRQPKPAKASEFSCPATEE